MSEPRTLSLFDAAEHLPPIPPERALEFVVHGEPRVQGNAKAVMSASTGRPFLKRTDRGLEPWRQDIARCALEARAARQLAGVLLEGPVRLVVRFRLPRRKSWGRRSRLRDVAVRPDFDKLVRAVADALTGVVYGDDGQITSCLAQKRPAAVGEPPGVDIAVGPDADGSYP